MVFQKWLTFICGIPKMADFLYVVFQKWCIVQLKKPPMFVFKDIEDYKNRGKNVAWRIAKVGM